MLSAWLPRDSMQPQFRSAGSLEGSQDRSMAEQENLLAADLRLLWQAGSVTAAILAAPVLYGRGGSGERSPAVRLHIEAVDGYCVDIFMPYRIRSAWRRSPSARNRVHFSHPVAQQSDSRFGNSPRRSPGQV
ncbi:MAG TPA: hypothetical protein VGF82_09180 [Terracidiphilus sp.]